MFIYRLLLKFRCLYELFLSNEADALLFICIKLKSCIPKGPTHKTRPHLLSICTHPQSQSHAHTQGDSYVTTDEDKSEEHSNAVYDSEVRMMAIRRPVSKGFITSPQQQSSLATVVEQLTPHERVVSDTNVPVSGDKALKKHPPARNHRSRDRL